MNIDSNGSNLIAKLMTNFEKYLDYFEHLNKNYRDIENVHNSSLERTVHTITQKGFDSFLIDLEKEYWEKANAIFFELHRRGWAKLDGNVDIDELVNHPDLFFKYLELLDKSKIRAQFEKSIESPYYFITNPNVRLTKGGKIIFYEKKFDDKPRKKNEIVGYHIDNKNGIVSEQYSNILSYRKIIRKKNGDYWEVTSLSGIPFIFNKQVLQCSNCNEFFTSSYFDNLTTPGIPGIYCQKCKSSSEGKRKIRSAQMKQRKDMLDRGVNPDAFLCVSENPSETEVVIRDSYNQYSTIPYDDYLKNKDQIKQQETKKKSQTVSIRICKNCFKPLPADSRKSRETCSDKCRKEWSRKKKSEKVG